MTLPELLRCLHEYHEYKYMFSFKEYWNKSWILERKTTSVQNCATSISQLSGYMSYDTKSMDLVSLVRTSRLYPHGSRIHKKIALIIWKIAGLNRWICILAMFVHFNVYIYIYMHMYTYIYICTYVYMYICILLNMTVSVYIYIYSMYISSLVVSHFIRSKCWKPHKHPKTAAFQLQSEPGASRCLDPLSPALLGPKNGGS